jgi:hypothetical protein
MHSDNDRPDTVLSRVKSTVASTVTSKENSVHPIWKTIHVAVVVGSVTGFLSITSKTWEVQQEGYIIGGMALVMIVYAFGGDGVKVITAALSRFGGGGK